jgi:bacteriocin-like protein
MEKRIDETNRELSELTETELAAVSGGTTLENTLVTGYSLVAAGAKQVSERLSLNYSPFLL